MMWFLTCVAALIGGYFIYGAFVEKIFGINENRQTPAHTKTDGVDYVPMSTKRVYLVQLLNIAGVGPIFGPIMGAYTVLLQCFGLLLAVSSQVRYTITSQACFLFVTAVHQYQRLRVAT